jgi:hypothetical protein
MKHLKIYFAILFFSFLGGINAELMAQSNKLKVKDKGVSCKSFTLRSFNGRYELQVESTYIRILSQISGVIWRIDFPSTLETMQVLDNGNCVAYDVMGNIVWQTGTTGRGGGGTHLQIQDDGNLVLYNGSWYGGDGDALWATGTCGGVVNGCGEVGAR